ncbi:MAG TPA: transglutaminase family protein [Acidimicrobiales bacterium]|nr:transglutaminase family protein [Acidimicrobiales bacterium]
MSESAEVVVQIAASESAGRIDDAHFEVLTDGRPPSSLAELRDPEGATMHVVHSDPGRLTVRYRARIRVNEGEATVVRHDPTAVDGGRRASDYERQVYLRPSRYCPSEHLIGFAVAEFGAGPDAGLRVAAITDWIRERIGYVPGSSTVHDSAEDTLLTGMGTCRDFAHLGIALCRATGVPARFAAVYAPGLSPMDFHAVFEAFQDGRWWVYDATGLAPRTALVRVVTGRDAADTAFAAVTSGIADLEHVEVTAVAEPSLPVDDHSRIVELA